MENVSKKYSVFLTPARSDFIYCESLIGELSRRFDLPPFEPHVTVYSTVLDDPEELHRSLVAAIGGIEPFPLEVAGIGCSEEYFKTLFVEFREQEVLRSVHERIRGTLPVDSGYRLMPHLSLLYHEMPLADKQALARTIHLDRKVLLFDAFKIVTPCNIREGWRDTSRWQTVCRIGLGGRREALC